LAIAIVQRTKCNLNAPGKAEEKHLRGGTATLVFFLKSEDRSTSQCHNRGNFAKVFPGNVGLPFVSLLRCGVIPGLAALKLATAGQ